MALQKLFSVVVAALVLTPASFRADLADNQKLEQDARTSYIQRFVRFMQDQNVMGKPRTPDGKAAVGDGPKTRFNGDDGLAYQSDLTYHDFSFTTTEDEKGPDGKVKHETLPSFVSAHGKDDASVGSSKLEREVYNAHKAASKAQQDGKSEDDPEKGIRYSSIFKITTREVEKPPEPAAPDPNNPPPPVDKKETIIVDRRELTDDAREKIAKVGEDSFQSIQQSSRDEDSKNDPKALANGVLLRVAGAQAAIALDQSTAANLAQRWANQSIRVKDSGVLDVTPQLSESIPNCSTFTQTLSPALSKVTDPDQRKRIEDEIQRMSKQCKELSGLDFEQVAPKYYSNDNGDGEVLKSRGVGKEDGIERDLRVQLQTLRKAGIDPNDIPNNWGYSDEDKRARVTVVSEDGSKRDENLTVNEQLDSYNRQLEEAANGYKEVATRLPTLKMDPNQILQYKIEPGTRSVMDINQPPQSAMEELGQEFAPGADQPPAYTYDELLTKARE